MALTAKQMKNKLETGWKGYQAGPTMPAWSKLEEVLHNDIVWHDAHSSTHQSQPFVDYSPKNVVLTHFADCWNNGPYNVPDRKSVAVLSPNLAVVYDEMVGQHGCIDVYRFESDLIREMWTCVAEPP
jgi:hypothetical protein